VFDRVKINTKQKIRLFFDILRRKRSIIFTMISFIIFFIVVFFFYNIKSRQTLNSEKPKPNVSISNSDTKQSAPTESTSSAISSPDSLLNLVNWELTLPIDTNHLGNPDEIKWPELKTFTSPPYFQLNNDKTGVVFRAPVSGVTTANSNFPRSELREMTDGGTQEASWSTTSGTHTMRIGEAITHLPTSKPEVVAGQIHDTSSDVIMIRLERQNLFVQSSGQNIGTLDPAYVLGTPFTVEIVAGDGHIKVFYNDVQKLNYNKNGDSYYFKAGCYTQSNMSTDDNPDAYGEVVIYELKVTHS